MELFLPSLLTIVLAAIVFFVLMPKLSPYILGGLALAMLILGAYQHYTMFPYEYRMSTVVEALKDYTPFIILGILILGLLVIVGTMFGITPPGVAEALPAMPAMNIMGNKGANNKGVLNVLGGNNRPANNKGGVLNVLAGNQMKNNTGTMFTTV